MPLSALVLLAPVAVLCSFAGAFLATRTADLERKISLLEAEVERVWLLIHHRG